MHEPNRKFKACIFCDGPIDGTEHLFGKKIAKGLGITEHWQALNASTDPSTVGRVERGPSPGSYMTVKALCSGCNRDRFGPVMQRVTPVVLSMKGGTRRKISADEARSLRHYIERISLIVDICTSNFDIDDERRATAEYAKSAAFRMQDPVRSGEDRSAWLEGKDVRLRSAVGFMEDVFGKQGDMNVAHAIRWPNGLEMPANFHTQTSKRITVAFRHLVLYAELVGEPAPNNVLPSAMVELDGSSFTWPPVDRLSVDDYYSLRSQDELVSSIRSLSSMLEKRPA
jgi:hypothetical protein